MSLNNLGTSYHQVCFGIEQTGWARKMSIGDLLMEIKILLAFLFVGGGRNTTLPVIVPSEQERSVPVNISNVSSGRCHVCFLFLKFDFCQFLQQESVDAAKCDTGRKTCGQIFMRQRCGCTCRQCKSVDF